MEEDRGDKFAPEPWCWDQADDIDDGFVFFFGLEHARSGASIPVQRKIEWEHGLDPDENARQFAEAEATADLIVAAPKLLKACEAAIEVFRDMGLEHLVVFNQIVAAVDQARGDLHEPET